MGEVTPLFVLALMVTRRRPSPAGTPATPMAGRGAHAAGVAVGLAVSVLVVVVVGATTEPPVGVVVAVGVAVARLVGVVVAVAVRVAVAVAVALAVCVLVTVGVGVAVDVGVAVGARAVVSSDAELLPLSGSGSFACTDTWFRSGPGAVGLTTMVSDSTVPGLRLLARQLTTVVPVQLAALFGAGGRDALEGAPVDTMVVDDVDTSVVFAGSVSVTVSVLAVDGPLFCTRIV